MSVLITILAVYLSHSLRPHKRLRDLHWLRIYSAWLTRHAEKFSPLRGVLGLALLLVVPLGLLFLLYHWLGGFWYGWLGWLLALGVLFYSLGPRDLDKDVERCQNTTENAAEDGTDGAMADGAKLRLIAGHPGAGDYPTSVVVLGAAMQRWFAVIFWFLILGPVGALAYRILQQLTMREDLGEHLSDAQADTVSYMNFLMDFPVAWLLAITMPLVAHFDTALGALRDYLKENGTGWIKLKRDVLFAVSRAAISDALKLREKPQDFESAEALDCGRILAWRLLFLWLTLMAILVLGGWVV